MRTPRLRNVIISLGVGLGVAYLALVGFVARAQASLLYHPTHDAAPRSALRPWLDHGAVIGYARIVERPATIWLMTHGNAGQAADRDYVLPCLSPADSLYVLEYPGYGARPGKPSRASFDAAAQSAYRILRAEHPGVPVCVIGESIGSGPACVLASEPQPPERIVLVVPFDTLVSVAKDHFPWLPVRWLLRDRWDNIHALSAYHGRVEIFGARDDRIIPVSHAERLAARVAGARFHLISGGHNGWASGGEVRISND